MVSFSLLANHFCTSKGIESVVGGAISAQVLLVGQPLHGLGLIEVNLAAVDSVTGLALITHGTWVTHVDCCAIAHKPFHCLDGTLGLVKARERCHLDLRL